MSPKIGRPTEDPKKTRVGFRLTEDESAMIDYCCEVFAITKTEVIRQSSQIHLLSNETRPVSFWSLLLDVLF